MAVVTKSIGTGVGSAGTGTISCSGTTAVNGSGTSFTTELTAPGTIYFNSTLYQIASITDDTNLTLAVAGPSVSGVAFTLGLRAYSTMTLWEADLDDTGIYSADDDAVGECYNDSAFDESVLIDGGGTVGLSSVTLTVAEGERHDGTAGTGAVMRGDGTIVLNITGGPSCDIEWLEVDGGRGAWNVGYRNAISYNSSGSGGNAHHNLLHGFHSFVPGGISFESAGWTGRAYNNIIYDINSDASLTGTRAARGILSSGGTSGRQRDILHNTVHSIHRGADGSACGIVWSDGVASDNRNNIVTDVTGGETTSPIACFDPSSASSAVVSHNASSDATASSDNETDTGINGVISGTTFTASGENFTTSGVAADDWVNFADNEEYAKVVSVDSNTQLTLDRSLTEGTDLAYSISDSIRYIDAADQYVSTTVGSEDLHIKEGSDLIGAGADLSATGIDGIEFDIDGDDRTDKDWDIGADQYVAAVLTAFFPYYTRSPSANLLTQSRQSSLTTR